MIAARRDQAAIEAAALALEAVRRALDGKTPKKIIIVPQRIVNVVLNATKIRAHQGIRLDLCPRARRPFPAALGPLAPGGSLESELQAIAINPILPERLGHYLEANWDLPSTAPDRAPAEISPVGHVA